MKKKYEITLVGCDDETCFKMELTEEEAELLQRVSNVSKETSTYSCMPFLHIEEVDEDENH